MDRSAVFLIGAAGLSVGGWVMFRNSLRDEVERTLRDDHGYDRLVGIASGLATAFGARVVMPSSRELAESFVPIWATNSPQDAIEDVLAKGRASTYWPDKYRGGTPSKAEQQLFVILNTIYQSNKQNKLDAQGNPQ